MYKILLAISLAASPLMGFLSAPVLADDDSSAGTPDCSKASAMMQSTMASSPGAMMSDDHPMSVDANYLKSMKAMLDQQTMMAKIEMACGSNAVAKAKAKRALAESQTLRDQVTSLLRSIGV